MTGLPIETVEAMTAFLLVFFRITGMTLSAPIFSNRSFPTPLRVWTAVLLALMMFPIEWARLEDGVLVQLFDNGVGAILVVLSELAIGWTIGWIASVMVFAAQLAGHILGQEIGFSIGEVFDPVSGGQSAIVTQFFFTLGLVAFVLLGGPDLVISAVHHSFIVVPPGGAVAAAGMAPTTGLFDAQFLVKEVGSEMWRSGVTMALPGMVGLMIATAAMAILARAVPEMNVFVLGFTIRIVIGLFTTWLVLPFIGDVFELTMGVTAEMLEELFLLWRG